MDMPTKDKRRGGKGSTPLLLRMLMLLEGLASCSSVSGRDILGGAPLENFLEGLRGLSFTESIPSPKEENSSRSETSELKEQEDTGGKSAVSALPVPLADFGVP